MTNVDYFIEDDLFEDPYPIFDRLRTDAPIYWDADSSFFIATRWDDCERILNDPDTFGALTEDAIPTTKRAFGGSPTILTVDGPVHRDLRKAVDGPLRPKNAMSYIDTIITPAANARIDFLRTLGPGSVDLMETYFEPISVRALGSVMGIDGVNDDTLRRWFSGIISGLINIDLSDEGFAESDRASAEMAAVIRPIIERVTAEPDGSALSHMVHGGREPGNPRSAEELLPTLHVYIAGGMQEPGHGAGSTLLGLLTNPDQLERVASDLSLVPRAVEEGLRWIAPLGQAERRALREVEINGTVLPEGAQVLAMLGAANRDPEKFADPHRYDIDREEGKQMAFGGGRHFCAGNALGRAIIRTSIEQLLSAFPKITLDPTQDPVVNGWHFRAPRTLSVHLRGVDEAETVGSPSRR